MSVTVESLRLIHRVCTEFEVAWKSGKHQSIEDLLRSASELDLPRDQLLKSLIRSEVELRTDRGESPTADEYRQRFPCDVAVVESVFPPASSRADASRETADEPARTGATTIVEPGSPVPSSPRPLDTPRLSDRTDTPTPPTSRIGKFEVLGELARGGMGVVYRARHAELDRVVALKVILAGHFASPAEIERFRREAMALAQLDHPGIVPVLEVGEWAGHHFIAMPLVEGLNLAERMTNAAFSARHAAALVRDVAHAIHYAHDRGVIHRDIKPRNILLDRGGRPRVTDFGLAKFIAPPPDNHAESPLSLHGVTVTGQVLGTPSYMAPEQSTGRRDNVSPSADIYSIGAVLYELLTGRPPFRGESPLETLEQARTMEPPPPRRLNANVPRDLETICLKCLAKEPARRYPTGNDLADDLDRFIDGRPILARPTPAWERAIKWSRRRPVVASSLAFAAAALVTLIVAWAIFTAQLQVARYDAESARDKSRISRALAEARAIEANDNALRADHQRREAEINFQMAVDSVDRYCARVSDDPRLKEHDLRRLRRQLLETAVEFHQRFLDARGNEPGLKVQQLHAFYRLGNLTREIDALNRAEDCFARALELAKELVAEFPQEPAYRRELAQCQTALATLWSQAGDQAQALVAYQEAIAVLQELVREFPQAPEYATGLADTQLLLGRYFQRNRQFGESESAANQAMDICKELIERQPDVAGHRWSLAQNLSLLGDLCYHDNIRRWREADQHYQTGLEIVRSLVDLDPQNPEYRFQLARFLRNQSAIHRLAGRREANEATLKEAVAAMEQLTREHSTATPYQDELAVLYEELGMLYEFRGQIALAAAPLNACLAIRQRLYDRDPENLRLAMFLGWAMARKGTVAQEVENDNDAALAWFDRAITQFLAVLDRDPQFSLAGLRLGATYELKAQALVRMDRHADAAATWSLAIERANSPMKPWLQIRRLQSVAAGVDYQSAVREAMELLEKHPPTAPDSRHIHSSTAKVHAIAAARCLRDEFLSDADKTARSESFAVEAIRLLRRATELGTRDSKLLKTDPAYDAIRSREDFRAVVSEIERLESLPN